MGKGYTDTDVMLTHALVTYLGFEQIGGRRVKRATMAQGTEEVLARLGPVKDAWDIVWGPAGYRAPLMPFDSAAMYVARSRTKPLRFVIAVRGTNPVSVYDWMFGDLAVTRQVPWAFDERAAAAGAKISFSSAFGLSVLQHLRWEPEKASSLESVWASVEERMRDGLRGATRRHQDGLSAAKSGPLQRLRRDLQDSLGGVTDLVAVKLPDKLDDVLERVYERKSSLSHSAFGKTLDEAVDRLGETRLDPLRLVMGGSELRRLFASGVDLRSFLEASVADAGEPVEIFVTGHSKGGALSSTLALWLADTQGADGIAEDDRWDPERRATVHAYSFAGPTAGNSPFAAHSDAVIGPRCHRIANRLDIVPRAWAVEDLQQVPELYDESVHRPEVLRALADDLVKEVGPLDYHHVGNHVSELSGVLDPEKRWFVEQAVHQHLDGYLEQLGLADEMSTTTFFSPIG